MKVKLNKNYSFNPYFIMPFGQYKGDPLNEIPSGYLRWLVENEELELGGELLFNIRELLRREGED